MEVQGEMTRANLSSKSNVFFLCYEKLDFLVWEPPYLCILF